MKRLNFNIKDRKVLYGILGIVLVSVFSLTIAYAALNAVLTISGSAQVSSADWDVHFDNVKVISGSVSGDEPRITSPTTATFSTTLNMPGDYYEFTIDVVNDGSIDAMIENITKTPTLSVEQAKYLKYEITYQNGESITTKQLVEKDSYVRLKVRLEYRSDITSSDLPASSETLNLGLKLDYIQSDGSGSSVKDNGVYEPYKIGNEICFDTECFYVMYSDETSVTMLAKYNLYVGGEYNSGWTAYGEEATGKQDSNMLGYVLGQTIIKGTSSFSNTNYWPSPGNSYPYIYDSNSVLYSYVENYKTYLSTLGVTPSEARLITKEELDTLGCSSSGYSCNSAPSWVYATSYWSGSGAPSGCVWTVDSFGDYDSSFHSYNNDYGCRPVIVISKDYFAKEKISFTLVESNYQADVGMTWEEWCNSEYNDYGCGVFEDYIIDMTAGAGNKKYYVCLEESGSCVEVLKNDLIIDGASYGLKF